MKNIDGRGRLPTTGAGLKGTPPGTAKTGTRYVKGSCARTPYANILHAMNQRQRSTTSRRLSLAEQMRCTTSAATANDITARRQHSLTGAGGKGVESLQQKATTVAQSFAHDANLEPRG